MRRLVSVAIAAVALLALAAPAAAQAPEIIPAEPVVLGPEVFGDACDFPLEAVDTFAVGSTKLFPVDENGDQRMLITGLFRSTFTNLDTGESVEMSFGGRVQFIFRADGTVEFSGSGGTVNWFTSEDVHATLGRGVFVVHGHVTGRADAETFLLLEPDRITGRVMDLCAALS